MGTISDELRSRMENNPVFHSMETVEDIAEQIASGVRKNAVVSGPTGLGKNHFFEQAFKKYGRAWRPERPTSDVALIEQIQ